MPAIAGQRVGGAVDAPAALDIAPAPRSIHGRSVVTSYSFSTPYLGCVTRTASCPSLVNRMSPLDARSSLPDVERPSGFRRRVAGPVQADARAGRCSSTGSPTGLCSAKWAGAELQRSPPCHRGLRGRPRATVRPCTVTCSPFTATLPLAMSRSLAPPRSHPGTRARNTCNRCGASSEPALGLARRRRGVSHRAA